LEIPIELGFLEAKHCKGKNKTEIFRGIGDSNLDTLCGRGMDIL